MRLAVGDEDSEQTAAITSDISAGFSRKGCCSLIHNVIKKMISNKKKLQYLRLTFKKK